MPTLMKPKEVKALHGLTLTIEGRPYVAVPTEVLARLVHPEGARPSDAPKGGVDAREFARATIAKNLRLARQEAGLTQEELASRMKVSQTRISQAENGYDQVGLPFAKRWLKACGLPEDWKAPKKRGA